MKAIILAGGEGKRMLPLTLEKPKPLVEVAGKSLLHRMIEAMPDEVNEIILLIGYKGDQIRVALGESFLGKKITYVEQEKATGTAHAMALCRPHLTPGDRFLLSYADDLHDKASIAEMLKYDRAILTFRADPRKFSEVTVDSAGRVLDIKEKPDNPIGNLICPGVYLLDDRIFDYEPKLCKGEYYLTTQIEQLVRDLPMYAVETGFWIPVGYPEDIAKAEEALRAQKSNKKM